MGTYTAEDDPGIDNAVQDVLDMITEAILNLMGKHVRAIVLMGGYGRGEGGVYRNSKGYSLVNDFDLAVFVEKKFRNVKKEFSSKLKELSVELQPKCKGIKQIDLDITNSWHYRFVPNLLNYYEIRNGHKVIYGEIDLSRIMPDFKPERMPLYDGTIYFYSRGSGLLLPAIYFLTGNLDRSKIRENFLIELQKACQAMGDATLLIANEYHYSYQERLLRFEKLESNNNPIPHSLLEVISPLYRWGVERKLKPSFDWTGNDRMIKKWFEVRSAFSEFFLWFESTRLGNKFESWLDYSNYIDTKGPKAPFDVMIWTHLKYLRDIFSSFGKNSSNKRKIKRNKMAKLLPVMPLLLISLNEDGRFKEGILRDAFLKLNGSRSNEEKSTWLDLTKEYLSQFHPSGVVQQAIDM